MKCYFCHREIPNHGKYSGNCTWCTDTYGLQSVYTITDEEYAHIYIDRSKKINLPLADIVPSHLTKNYIIQEGFVYHIRLHLKENVTKIFAIADTEGEDYRHLLDVPGFTITPANAIDKLNTYLAFL